MDMYIYQMKKYGNASVLYKNMREETHNHNTDRIAFYNVRDDDGVHN